MKNTALIAIVFLVIGLLIGFAFAQIDDNKNISVPDLQRNRFCTYNGQTYEHGESFRQDCNTCSCQDGEVACTLIACE